MNITDFVGKYEPMNPETEFLVPGGYLLQNGMEILVANPDSRHNMTVLPEFGTWQYDRALERNRWSKISHLKYDHEYKLYRFVSTYSDGTQRLRNSEQHQPWFVKLDSVDVLQQKRKAVMSLVEDCLIPADPNEPPIDYPKLAASYTEDIMKIFGMGVQK